MYKVKPTKKQAKTMDILQKNPGMAVSKAMEAAGYSKATAHTPSNLTKAKAVRSIAEASGVTIKQYMMNIGDAMIAEKQNQFTGEVTPDYGVRLSANKQAREFLQLEDKVVNNVDLTQAINDNVDEIELQRLIFKKG